MPSHLRLQSSYEEPIQAPAIYRTSPSLPPAKKQKMSLTQAYYVASTARSKLGKEAGRADHNLRLLVGHANLLDSLMVELADAEREQEAWFNQSVHKANKVNEPRHVQWIDTIPEEEDGDDESDAGSDIYDEDEELYNLPLRKISTPPVIISSSPLEEDSDDDVEFDDEYDEDLALQRVASKHSPPELTLDDDSDSEDDSMPSSPEQSAFELNEKEAEQQHQNFYNAKSQNSLEDYILQEPIRGPIIAAY